jgi:hypothetical protein
LTTKKKEKNITLKNLIFFFLQPPTTKKTKEKNLTLKNLIFFFLQPTKKGCKIGENQAAIFGGISRPKCTLLCPKIEKCKFKGQIK